MKNSILAIAFIASCLLFAFDLQAQTPMTKGNNIAMVGIGIGGYGHTGSSSVSPSFMGTFQRGIVDNLGPGNLSIGGTVAYRTGKFDGIWSDVRWNYFALAGRASYHPHFVKSEKFDLYGGLGLGYYSVNSKLESSDATFASASVSTVALTIHLGARYTLSDKIAVWAELGNELSVLSGGVAFFF